MATIEEFQPPPAPSYTPYPNQSLGSGPSYPPTQISYPGVTYPAQSLYPPYGAQSVYADSSYPPVINKQPEAMPSMSTSVNPRNPKNIPLGEDGLRDWQVSSNKCMCNSDCMEGCFCPCTIYARTKIRLEYLEKGEIYEGKKGSTMDCWLFGALCVIGQMNANFVLLQPQREAIRKRYGIRGSPWKDCVATTCNAPNVFVQQDIEIDAEEAALKENMRNQGSYYASLHQP